MTARLWFVRDRYGDGELERMASRTPAVRALVRQPPLPFVWCPFGDMIDVDRAIFEGPMKREPRKMREFGGAIAKHDLPTIYKVLFKIGTPGFLMKRVGIVAATYLRDSPMKGEGTPDGRVRVVQTGTTFPRYFCKLGVCGWFEAAVELSGGKNVRIDHSACRHEGAPNCEWLVKWT